MSKYYKVHKNNIIFFPNISTIKANEFIKVCNGYYDEYKPNNYIYIITNEYDDDFNFMPYIKGSIIYFKMCKYINCGEFKPLKEIRKEKLQKINNYDID